MSILTLTLFFGLSYIFRDQMVKGQIGPIRPVGDLVPPRLEIICENPRFSAGLAIPDPEDYSKYKRFLFWNQWMFPYIYEEKTIDSLNGRRIDQLFPHLGKDIEVGTAFHDWTNGSRIYLRQKYDSDRGFSGQEFHVYRVITRSQNSKELNFIYVEMVYIYSVPNEFLVWKINTRTEWMQYTSTSFFVDSTSSANGIGWNPGVQIGSSKSRFKFKLQFNGAMEDIEDRFLLKDQIFPNTLIFINNLKHKIRIPIEFDGYYQTLHEETIFFRDYFACITNTQTPTQWKPKDYCRTWVDTRSIIGCSEPTISYVGPQFDPNEPEDIDPDF